MPSDHVSDEIPAIDLRRWRSGDASERSAVAACVDSALRSSGFILVVGHGLDLAVAEQLRCSMRAFFDSPREEKLRYVAPSGYPGWTPTGAEANAYASGEESPPDLKESFTFGSVEPGALVSTIDGLQPFANQYPAMAPDIERLVEQYLQATRALANDLFELLAAALGAPCDLFTRGCDRAPYVLAVSQYPSLNRSGGAIAGQFRIGPHTDFGSITILDRQPGVSGLQVQRTDGTWVDAPYESGSLTINIGDLMARWTGGRWLSNMHRVPAPSIDAPDEELMSLVFFLEANMDAVIEPLAEPMGGGIAFPPVTVLDYLMDKMAAIRIDA